jgi:hypothetical protein
MGFLARLFGVQMGECKCSQCGACFSTKKIEEHAQYLLKMLIASGSTKGRIGYDPVFSNLATVFHFRLAYCPKCVRSLSDISRYGRTVEKRELHETETDREKQWTAVDLLSLPTDLDTSKLKRAKLTYDPAERRLSFKGKMSDNERSSLSALSNDKRYKRAIRSLFLRSQGSTSKATMPLLSLQAGLGDKDYVYSKATLSPLETGHGISFVDYISDALWNTPKFRNNALKILHLVASAHGMDPNAATYAKKELADWEEEELHRNIVTVAKREGFIEITCPECGAQCPSLLSADDPVLETRSWGADCPSCGRAFNFKVVRKA